MATEQSTHPKFSIIVAAYNVENWISICLSSLLIPTMHDCEIIVVNDGSTDDTLSAVEQFAGDPRLVLVDKANGGPGDARNAGIDIARGTFFMFVDGDDWIEPNTIDSFRKALKKTPTADLLVFGFYEVYGDKRYASHCTANFWRITNSPCNKLFHRDLFDNVRFDKRIWYEDLAIVPALFARARNPITLNAVLYNYRRDRKSSIMNSLNFGRIYDLPVAAQWCLDRIHEDEASGRIESMRQRFGDDWEDRFLTIEIFIPGVLHRARRITDRGLRQHYIAEMMSRIPERRSIRLDVVREKYGLKMAAGSLLYRYGWNWLAHSLLHDTGAIKQWASARLHRGDVS